MPRSSKFNAQVEQTSPRDCWAEPRNKLKGRLPVSWLRNLFGRQKPLPASPEVEPTLAVEPVLAQEPPRQALWHVLGASVLGASHARSGLPNQDAIDWWPQDPGADCVVLAVADGHGSAKSFRSDVGARLAVETAQSAFRELLSGAGDLDPSTVKRALDDWLPMEIERRWKAAVHDQLAAHPLFVHEVAKLDAQQGEGARKAVEENPVLAYGTTLLAVALHEAFVACLQLGDGDILIVGDDAAVSRPIRDDPRLFANETTSLGGDQSWRDFRANFQSLAGRPPALVMLATDGYSNSFRSAEDFEAVGPDFLALLKTEGVAAVREKLPTWLSEASQKGSGDDVTVGILFLACPQQQLTGYHDDGQAEPTVPGLLAQEIGAREGEAPEKSD
jgi:serine/threonine protein phosphatase PrpC